MRVVIAVAVVVAGVIVAFVLGLVVLLLAARLVTAPWVFVGAGFLALVAGGLVTILAVGKILRLNGTWRSTLCLCLGLAMIAAITAQCTIFDRFPSMPVEPDPPGVQYWSIPDGRLAYYHLSAAPTSGRHAPVVFLHGGPGTPGEGLPMGSVELAAHGYDVYSYDQLGAGRSSRLRDVTHYTVEQAVDNLDQVRRAIGATKMILIGRSWGGSLLAQYVARHPDRVERAVFVTPGTIWGGLDEDVGEPWPTRDAADRREYEKLTGRTRTLLQSLLLGVSPNAAHAFVPDREADSWMRAVALTGRSATACSGLPRAPAHRNLQGFYSNQMLVADFGTAADPRPALAQVHVPALIMAAQCDFVRWPVTRRYVDAIPGAVLVPVGNAGHGIADDQPALFTRLITEFITGQPLESPPWRSPADPWTSPPGH
ncbi:alpha/beta fold hydrolase [Mycobacterium sp. NBC_00419]|uniref:alpha/beta fold hydrolase n=1 Tax=Mycobacterium sp. NBC_00419 TaxID=2975989 RepID=UPI002E1BE9F7